MWHLSEVPLWKSVGLGRLLPHKTFHSLCFQTAWTWGCAKSTGKDTCVRCLWESSFPWRWKGKESGSGWKEGAAPSATRVPLGASQGVRSWGRGSCCHQRVILSQVAPRPELTQRCRADPKDVTVCGKAPRNFTTHWTCSLDLPAANQLVLTFVVVSNQTRSSQAVWARVYVLAQLAISARIFVCLGPSADRGSAEQTHYVLHPAPGTGWKNSGETCCIFWASKEQLITDTELFLGGS